MDNAKIVADLRASNFVREKRLNKHISSFNFTSKAFYKQHWDEQTIRARGLFVGEDKEVVARSFDKFFDLKVKDVSKISYPVTVTKKYNGFLGILSYDKYADDLFIASKSTNEGSFAEIFSKILFRKYLTYNEKIEEVKKFLKQNNCSLVFEVISVEHDPHFVKYKEDQCVLLACIRNEYKFAPYPREDLEAISVYCGFPLAEKVCILKSFDELFDFLTYEVSQVQGEEGWVIQDSLNNMWKIKTEWYLNWKQARGLRDYVLHGLKETNDINQIEEAVLYHTKFGKKFTKEFCHWLIEFCYTHEIIDMPVIIDAWEHLPSHPQFLLQTEEK